MPMVIGVRFKNAGKLYYFNPGSLWPTAGDSVIIDEVARLLITVKEGWDAIGDQSPVS